MGRRSADAVEAAPDLVLAGRYDVGDELGDLAGAQVAVDFTVPTPRWTTCCARSRPASTSSSGTTGWTAGPPRPVRAALADRPHTGVLVAPNFAIGAVLLLGSREQAARFYESVEVVELHHPDKVDAPSGTASARPSVIAAARAEAGLAPPPDATTSDPGGARGADVDGIHVHAVRLRGLVAHEEVLFGGAGEQLTLRHDSFDRASFMPGVLAAVRAVVGRPGLTVGLEQILDLT